MNAKIKMSDVFCLPLSVNKGDLFNSKNPISDTRICKFFNMNQFDAASHAAHAINAYDALNQEVTELTQLLADEREKANARIEELECEMANMVDRI